MATMTTILIILERNNLKNGNLPDVMDVVEDAENICNYNLTDNDESENDTTDDENTIIPT